MAAASTRATVAATTDRPSRRPARRRRPGPGAVVAGSVALFVAVLTLMAVQLRAGRDPALGAAAVSARPVRHIVVHRVVIRRVITVIPSPEGDDTSGGGYGGGYSGGSSGSAASSAPSSAPAPAPAPAPVSRSS